MRPMDAYGAKRERMVTDQIQARGVRDPLVLHAMRRVRREEFVRPLSRSSAYADHPLPIALGQTISQPYIVALSVEAARVDEYSHVLDIGTGSGYAAAVLAEIVHDVVSIERHPKLADGAREVLARLGYSNVTVVTGDGTLGWADAAPYDAIVVAAAAPRVPDPWLEQLKEGGRLVMPLGTPGFGQKLKRFTLGPDRIPEMDDLGGVTFVPLIGTFGVGAPLFEEGDD
jgi:protein-L-isoaspartate(D-aspartate) O-methyltransferase